MSATAACRLFRLSALIIATLALFGCGKGGIRGPGSDFVNSLSSLQSSNRGVSTAPSGPANQITDLALVNNGDGTFNVTWRYRCLGDYNQDGSVGVPDITSIAMFYGQDAPSDQPNSLQAVTDGSGNNKVDVSDVTPIAMCFGVSCAGFIIEGSSVQEGIYAQTQDVPLSESIGMGRKQFNVRLDNTAYKYCRVRPYDSDGNPGQESNYVILPDPPPGDPPDITSVSLTSGCEGSAIQLTAVVTGELPLTYAWDFGGGATPNTSSEASPTITLGAAGDYSASLTVMNENGQDTFPFALSVYALAGRGDWWTYRHDPQLTGMTASIGPSTPKLAWKKSMANAIYCAVQDANGRIAIASGGWSFYVLNALGQQDWMFSNGYDLKGNVAITADGSFVFGCSDGNLYCLDPEGEERWHFPTGDGFAMTTPAIAPDGTIAIFSSYISSSDFYIITPDGAEVVNVEADGHKGDIAVGLDGNFYWCQSDVIYGYDTAGNLVLNQTPEEFIRGFAINQQGEIITVGMDTVYAYLTDGTVSWHIDNPDQSWSDYNPNTPALGPNGEVYVLRGNFLDFYDSTHTRAWRFENSLKANTPPIVDGEGKVYLGDVAGEVLCIGADGRLLWNMMCTSGVENSASMTITEEGLLLVPSPDGNLYAFEQGMEMPTARGPWWTLGGNERRNSRSPYVGPKTNHVAWSYNFGSVNSPIIGSDGCIYINSNKALLALNPDGTKKWEAGLGFNSTGTTTQAPDGTIIVPAKNYLVGMDTNAVINLHKYASDGWRGCAMADTAGNIFAMSKSSGIFGYNAAGNQLWNLAASVDEDSTIALGPDGMLYYANNNAREALKINPLTGASSTVYNYSEVISEGFSIGDDGKLYGNSGKTLLCINTVSDSLEWSYTADMNLMCLPAIAADGTAYISAYSGNLYKVDSLGNGSVFYTTGNPIGQCTIDADGSVYFFSGATLYAVDSTGTLLWQYATVSSSDMYGAPAIAPDGTLYVGSTEGKVFAFKDEV